MKKLAVLLTETGETKEFPSAYAARLIEQGKAVIAPKAPKKPAKKAVTADGPAE